MVEDSEARKRVLDAAEHLFEERGYGAVTVKDIARAANIHHSSLYHHAPAGKEGLYVEVMERNLRRHQGGMQQAVEAGSGDLRAQLQKISAWLIAQPPMDIIRMVKSDLPAIQPDHAEHLTSLAYAVLFEPITEVLMAAQARGEIDHPNLGNISGAIFSAIESLHMIPDAYLEISRQHMAEEIIDVFIRGLSAR